MSKGDVISVVTMMIQSAGLVQERFAEISNPDDFVTSHHGTTLLDAISMRLQVIGESVKRLQKIDDSVLHIYDEIEWDKIAKFRDLVSHHYEQVDHEIVYDICDVHIPKLYETLHRMSKDLESG
jgi:uncharacterized protein with HEPN domain